MFNANPSPKLDLVARNMGAALYLCNQAQSIQDGFFRAKEIIQSKEVFGTLESFKTLSHQHLQGLQ